MSKYANALNSCDVNQQKHVESAIYAHTVDGNRFLPLANCVQYIPGIADYQRTGQGVDTANIDTDSELRNMFRPLTKVPSRQYQAQASEFPYRGTYSQKDCNSAEGKFTTYDYFNEKPKSKSWFSSWFSGEKKEADCLGLVPRYTRMEYQKPCNLAGVCIDRFDPVICGDHQCLNRIHSNEYIGENTYLTAIDEYERKQCQK